MSRWNWDKVRRLRQKWIATWYDASDRAKRRVLVGGVALLCVLWLVGGSLQPANRFKGLPPVDLGSATSRDWTGGSSSSSSSTSSGTMTRDSRLPPDRGLGREEAPKPWTEAELTELAKIWIGIEDALCSAHEVYKKHAQGEDSEEERQIRGHANAWRSFMAAIPPPPASLRAQHRKKALEPATRAIVLPAGGPGLLQLGLVGLQALRYRARCSLPVEVFYQDAGEAPSPELEAWVSKALGPVIFRDISQVAQRAYKMRQNGEATL